MRMRVLLYCVTALFIAGVAAESGPIQGFRQKSNGGDYIELEWTLTATDSPLLKYTLILNEDTISDVRCRDSYCTEIVSHLQGCGTYEFELIPHFDGPDGEYMGESAKAEGNTTISPPGLPMDVVVVAVTTDSISIAWESPLENPLCVDRYALYYGEAQTSNVHSLSTKTAYFATISSLESCTEYIITLYALSGNGMAGPSVTVHAETLEKEPLPVSYLILENTSPTSINAIWGSNPDDSCAGRFHICLEMRNVPENMMCEYVDVDDNDRHNLTFNDLCQCSVYSVGITVISPKSHYRSIPIYNLTLTEEFRPGPVMNLEVSEVTAHSFSVNFDKPPTHPSCKDDKYVIDIIDLDSSGDRLSISDNDTDVYVDNLRACTHYLIKVSAFNCFFSAWEEVSAVTSDDQPSDPRQLSVNATSEHSVTLSWMEPEFNGRCTTHYTLEWKGVDDKGNATIGEGPNLPSEMQYTVDGLDACTEYTFALTATSATSGSSDRATVIEATNCYLK